MPATTEEPIIRHQMTLSEYLQLPEYPKTEWARGEVLIMPPPRPLHQIFQHRLANVLETALPDCVVMPASGLALINSRRIPDLMVIEREKFSNKVWTQFSPLLVVEIISPATRTNDMVGKMVEYLAAGIQQYWIVDYDLWQITVLANGGANWDLVAILDNENPTTEIEIASQKTVQLDLSALFAPA